MHNVNHHIFVCHEFLQLFHFQLKELSCHPISVEFEKEMTSKFNLLSKASDIQSSLFNVSSLLENGDSSIIKKLTKIIKELEKVIAQL